MTEALRITYHGLDRSPATDRLIEEQAQKLFQLFDRISSCRVVVETPHRRHTKGNHFVVSVEVHVPGDVLVVNRDRQSDARHEDIGAAVRDSFQLAVRMLRHYMQRQHA